MRPLEVLRVLLEVLRIILELVKEGL